jgi:hypothetical protein
MNKCSLLLNETFLNRHSNESHNDTFKDKGSYFSGDSLEFEKISIKIGFVFVLNKTMPYDFIEVKKIHRYHDGNYILIGRKLISDTFNSYYYAYEIKITDEIIEVSPKEIKHHKSVNLQKIDNLSLLPFAFFVV